MLAFKPFIPHLPDPRCAWLVLAMSSTPAGNLSVLGSVANLIVVHGARHEAHISFREYCRTGIPLSTLTMDVGLGRLN